MNFKKLRNPMLVVTMILLASLMLQGCYHNSKEGQNEYYKAVAQQGAIIIDSFDPYLDHVREYGVFMPGNGFQVFPPARQEARQAVRVLTSVKPHWALRKRHNEWEKMLLQIDDLHLSMEKALREYDDELFQLCLDFIYDYLYVYSNYVDHIEYMTE